MSKPIIHLPIGAKSFVLEDSTARIQWFMEHLSNWTIAKTADEGTRILAEEGPFDLIFLDHDLGLLDYAGKAGPEGNGQVVAQSLAAQGERGGKVIIHSWNPRGAAAMKALLPDARMLPFGQFLVSQRSE